MPLQPYTKCPYTLKPFWQGIKQNKKGKSAASLCGLTLAKYSRRSSLIWHNPEVALVFQPRHANKAWRTAALFSQCQEDKPPKAPHATCFGTRGYLARAQSTPRFSGIRFLARKLMQSTRVQPVDRHGETALLSPNPL